MTKYFSQGSIIADSREAATGLMVITSGQVGVELPMDSDEADEEHRTPGGKTQLYVFSRGSAARHNFLHYVKSYLKKVQGLNRGERNRRGQAMGRDFWC